MPDEYDLKVTVLGKEHLLSYDSLDFGELAEIERITGQGYNFDVGGIAATVAFAYIAAKRENAAVSLADIYRLKRDDILMEEAEDGPPSPSANGNGLTVSADSTNPDSRNGSDVSRAATPADIGTKSSTSTGTSA